LTQRAFPIAEMFVRPAKSDRRLRRSRRGALCVSAAYSQLATASLLWLPAIELRGEGIYLGFDEKTIHDWQESRAHYRHEKPRTKMGWLDDLASERTTTGTKRKK
jgi:hypothetical protein